MSRCRACLQFIVQVQCRQCMVFCLKLLTIYTILSVCLYPLLSYHLRFSKLYQHDKKVSTNNVYNINMERRTQAWDFLKTLNANKTKEMYLRNQSKKDLSFAIGVITIARNVRRTSTSLDDFSKPEYLTQVTSRLHQVLVQNNATDDVFMFLCNVDKEPEEHQEASYLSTFFPNITRIYATDAKNDYRLRKTRHSSERQDYAFCLESASKYSPKYVILIEDDAYPHADFYDILNTTLSTKLETRIQRGELVQDPKDWAWLKLSILYHKNDFHREPFTNCQWVALTCTIAGFISLAFYLCQSLLHLKTSIASDQQQRKQKNLSLFSYIVFIFSFMFFFATTWAIGRPYYLKFLSISQNFYHLEPGTSCCTQAVLYPADKVPGVANFLRSGKKNNIPMDWAMDEYRREEHLKQYLVTPNIFTHIGLYSTLNLRIYKDRSFAYEYFTDWVHVWCEGKKKQNQKQKQNRKQKDKGIHNWKSLVLKGAESKSCLFYSFLDIK